MKERTVAEKPDPAWVAALREGDPVTLAERGRWVWDFTVLRITPKGTIKIGMPGQSLRNASAFGPDGYAKGAGVWGIWRRYLVAPEAGGGPESVRQNGDST